MASKTIRQWADKELPAGQSFGSHAVHAGNITDAMTSGNQHADHDGELVQIAG